MEKAVTSLLRGASERGLDSLLVGENAVILLGYIRNTVDLNLVLPEETRSPLTLAIRVAELAVVPTAFPK